MPAVDKSNQRYLQVAKDFNDRAVACRQEKDFKCAIKNDNGELHIDRESAVLDNNRGVVHLEQNKLDPTISEFSRAYRLLSRLLKSDSRDVTVEPSKMLLTREED